MCVPEKGVGLSPCSKTASPQAREDLELYCAQDKETIMSRALVAGFGEPLKTPRYRYQFQYAAGAQATVTVYAPNYSNAVLDAREKLDTRYEKRGKEPPAGFTLVFRSTSNPLDARMVDIEPWG
jgi:hypothetical protein